MKNLKPQIGLNSKVLAVAHSSWQDPGLFLSRITPMDIWIRDTLIRTGHKLSSKHKLSYQLAYIKEELLAIANMIQLFLGFYGNVEVYVVFQHQARVRYHTTLGEIYHFTRKTASIPFFHANLVGSQSLATILQEPGGSYSLLKSKRSI